MWKYLGGGFIPGVPARDLTDDEARGYGLDLLKASGLYEEMKAKEKPRPSEDKMAKGPSEDKD